MQVLIWFFAPPPALSAGVTQIKGFLLKSQRLPRQLPWQLPWLALVIWNCPDTKRPFCAPLWRSCYRVPDTTRSTGRCLWERGVRHRPRRDKHVIHTLWGGGG